MADVSLTQKPSKAPPSRSRAAQRTLEAVIKRAVLREWRRQRGNLSATARELAISRQTLLNYLDAWKLKVNDGRRNHRVFPAEKRWEQAVEHKFIRLHKRGAWTERPAQYDVDLNVIRHGNSEEVARQAEEDFYNA